MTEDTDMRDTDSTSDRGLHAHAGTLQGTVARPGGRPSAGRPTTPKANPERRVGTEAGGDGGTRTGKAI